MIMNINIWQLPEKRIKKAVSKTVVMNDLWFFINFCMKYECKSEIFVKKAAAFSIS